MTTPQEAAQIIVDEVLQKKCSDAAKIRSRMIRSGMGIKAPHLTRWVRWSLINVVLRDLASMKSE